MGSTDLNEDAQDGQALRHLSSLAQAVIGFRIIMHDVELRGKVIESFNVSPFPPPPTRKALILATTTASMP